jgi:RNA polymerase sigma-70 factor (ECF subfamily)
MPLLASHIASDAAPPLRSHDATFEAVYRVMFDFVRRVVCQQPIRPADRDDAVQDVFMVAYRRWGQLESDHSLRAWLHSIAVRTCWNYQRAHRRWSLRFAPSYDGMEERMDVDAPAADQQLAHHEDLRQLGEAVEQLCEKHRDAILLSRIEGRSAVEVSNMTALSPNTISSRVRAALFELRETLRVREISPRGRAASRTKK